MITISQAARRYRLSRSTLLYYDRLGLVRPTYRTAAGYRLYQEEELERLEWICRYRASGMPLEEIGALLDPEGRGRSRVEAALHRRLDELNRQIAALRRQQQVAFELLGGRGDGKRRTARAMTKRQWVALLREAGMTDAEMAEWHRAFERRSPAAHQDFLESLGIDPEEIRAIRAHSGKRNGTEVSDGGKTERESAVQRRRSRSPLCDRRPGSSAA